MMTFKQSFAHWSFVEGREPQPGLLAAAAEIGYSGVDFLPAELWPEAHDLGLDLVIIDGHVPLEVGFIDRTQHVNLSEQIMRALDSAVKHNVRNLSVASGDRGPDTPDTPADALSACVEALVPLAAEAEAAGVGLLLEPLNTKVDHKGHECDSTAWAAEVVERVGSPALRILYDFYHSQIMEGDLLNTVASHFPRIGHYHTAGVPGRHEIDDQQEVNYRGIAAALRQHGYTGYVAHEFIPRTEPVDALRYAYSVFAVD